jgi:hypothetical protein
LRLRRVLQIVVVLLAIAFIGLQFIRPERTNPAVVAADVLIAPRNVQPILKRSCYNCHSSETRWPWYSHIAPFSWRVVQDVREGREEMSFSEWNTYDKWERARLLEKICEQVEKGKMPLKPYVIMHPSADLTIEDQRALCVWAKQAR